eukprot:TRINITY_DN61123_c0_g1_i1.p1 TRINITY_DN61123_c0_g1~~TRINITY_DN61123_c0_g1_i1.p1  ORF type:complete len:440 (+),score=58.89 TRINITY_DN61123_c0_g1_i1:77-1321(+)
MPPRSRGAGPAAGHPEPGGPAPAKLDPATAAAAEAQLPLSSPGSPDRSPGRSPRPSQPPPSLTGPRVFFRTFGEDGGLSTGTSEVNPEILPEAVRRLQGVWKSSSELTLAVRKMEVAVKRTSAHPGQQLWKRFPLALDEQGRASFMGATLITNLGYGDESLPAQVEWDDGTRWTRSSTATKATKTVLHPAAGTREVAQPPEDQPHYSDADEMLSPADREDPAGSPTQSEDSDSGANPQGPRADTQGLGLRVGDALKVTMDEPYARRIYMRYRGLPRWTPRRAECCGKVGWIEQLDWKDRTAKIRFDFNQASWWPLELLHVPEAGAIRQRKRKSCRCSCCGLCGPKPVLGPALSRDKEGVVHREYSCGCVLRSCIYGCAGCSRLTSGETCWWILGGAAIIAFMVVVLVHVLGRGH